MSTSKHKDRLNNIETIYTEVKPQNPKNMSEETQNVAAQLSDDDLQAELKRRQEEKEQKAQQERDLYEKDNEDFIGQTIAKFQQLNSELTLLKEYTIKEANKLYHRMYALEGKEPKEQKTFSRVNKAQNVKITVEMQEKFAFTDEADVHLDAIKSLMQQKFSSRNKGFYNFMERILMKNNKGEFDPKLLTKAKKEARELDYPELIEELEKLDKCQTVIGSSLYCRAYVKNGKNKWQDVSLNFSSL